MKNFEFDLQRFISGDSIILEKIKITFDSATDSSAVAIKQSDQGTQTERLFEITVYDGAVFEIANEDAGNSIGLDITLPKYQGQTGAAKIIINKAGQIQSINTGIIDASTGEFTPSTDSGTNVGGTTVSITGTTGEVLAPTATVDSVQVNVTTEEADAPQWRYVVEGRKGQQGIKSINLLTEDVTINESVVDTSDANATIKLKPYTGSSTGTITYGGETYTFKNAEGNAYLYADNNSIQFVFVDVGDSITIPENATDTELRYVDKSLEAYRQKTYTDPSEIEHPLTAPTVAGSETYTVEMTATTRTGNPKAEFELNGILADSVVTYSGGTFTYSADGGTFEFAQAGDTGTAEGFSVESGTVSMNQTAAGFLGVPDATTGKPAFEINGTAVLINAVTVDTEDLVYSKEQNGLYGLREGSVIRDAGALTKIYAPTAEGEFTFGNPDDDNNQKFTAYGSDGDADDLARRAFFTVEGTKATGFTFVMEGDQITAEDFSTIKLTDGGAQGTGNTFDAPVVTDSNDEAATATIVKAREDINGTMTNCYQVMKGGGLGELNVVFEDGTSVTFNAVNDYTELLFTTTGKLLTILNLSADNEIAIDNAANSFYIDGKEIEITGGGFTYRKINARTAAIVDLEAGATVRKAVGVNQIITAAGDDGNGTFTFGNASYEVSGNVDGVTFNIDGNGNVMSIDGINGGESVKQVGSSATATYDNSTASPVTLASGIEIGDASSRTLAIKIVGNALDNSILGGSGKDSLYGGNGNDSLIGGAGADKLYGQNGNDILDGGDGYDTLSGGAGNDKIIGGTGNDSLSGGDGTDYLDGGANNDKLLGGNGNDTLIGGSGNDTLTGGAGNDLFVYTAGNDVIADYAAGDKISISGEISKSSIKGSDATFTIGGNTLTVKNGNGQELAFIDADGNERTIIGGAFVATNSTSAKNTLAAWREVGDASARTTAIRLVGNALNNTILGSAGNDTLYGKDGNDYLAGNAGNDKLYGQNGNDTLTGGSGNDLFIYESGNDLIIDMNATDTLQIGNGTGTYSKETSGNDILVKVGEGLVTLKGAATLTTVNIFGEEVSATVTYDDNAASAVTLASGVEVADASTRTTAIKIVGDELNNSIVGGTGKDTLYGKDGADTLVGGSGADKLYGQNGNDSLSGGAGNDTLSGGSGNDKLLGGSGNDSLSGGDDNDTLSGGSGNDKLLGGNGNDSLSGGDGKDTLSGGSGNDKLLGGNGNDFLNGDDGNDSLSGGAGNDTLLGGDGKDTLSGGSGNDVFIYSAGNDLITDMSATDTLQIGDGTDTYSKEISGFNIIVTVGNALITLKGAATLSAVNIDGEEILPIETYNNSAATNVTMTAGILIGDASSRTTAIKITGNELDNSILGGRSKDSLYGADGNDYLVGNANNDILNGGAGEDTLWGGADNDTLTGGDGADTFIYNAGEGKDVITDFGDDDFLEINGNFSASYAPTENTITFKVGTVSNAITLKDCTAKTIHVNDTVFFTR